MVKRHLSQAEPVKELAVPATCPDAVSTEANSVFLPALSADIALRMVPRWFQIHWCEGALCLSAETGSCDMENKRHLHGCNTTACFILEYFLGVGKACV